MDWVRDAGDWPLAGYSTFVESPPHRWHVQILGEGPDAVLLHGAGGATQSFRHLAPLLARRHRVVMMDLPGQGFTRMGTRQRCGLRPVTEDIRALLEKMDVSPEVIVGHSAGAAIALSLAVDRPLVPVVGINPALGNFEGAAGWLFPMLAKALALTPLVPQVFARAARTPGRVEGLLASTGSALDPAGTALYRRLVRDPGHVEATLLMMAQWSIDGLLDRLPAIGSPTLFLVGGRDGAVPPKVAALASARMPDAAVTSFAYEGHLLHETAPWATAEAIAAFLDERVPDQPSRA